MSLIDLGDFSMSRIINVRNTSLIMEAGIVLNTTTCFTNAIIFATRVKYKI
jgi:hypothetical protein